MPTVKADDDPNVYLQSWRPVCFECGERIIASWWHMSVDEGKLRHYCQQCQS